MNRDRKTCLTCVNVAVSPDYIEFERVRVKMGWGSCVPRSACLDLFLAALVNIFVGLG